jgi:hypothetical protein
LHRVGEARARRRDAHRVGGALIAVALVVGIAMVGTSPSGAATPKFPGAAWSRSIGPTHLSSPVIADVNGDGTPDVVTADLSGWVHVLGGRSGRDLPGWPQPIQINPGQTVASESSPTVADLDKNGRKEIIVGAGSLEVGGQQGGVEAFNANGTPRWRIRTQTLGGENGVPGTPAVGDVNGDGHPDVVFGSWDHGIYAVNRFGQLLPGFPYNSLDTIWDSPALAEVGHTGKMDIFLGGDASPGGPCGSWSWAGVLRAIRVTPSGPQVRWTKCQHQIFQSSPAIGDLDGNGRLALVIGTGTGASGDALATNSLHAFHLDDGSPVRGWPVVLNGPIFGSPVIGDVTGDHKNDVVVAACASCNSGGVWAFTGHGKKIWSRFSPIDHTEILSTPILVDLDGNGVNDVAVGQAGQFYLLRGTDGAELYKPIEMNRIEQNSAAVADFGPGTGWRMIVQSWVPRGDGRPAHGAGQVDAIPLPQQPAITPAWPQWRSNAEHTGGPLPAANANTGYWTAGQKGGVFPYGNARAHGSLSHMHQPVVGMASSPSGKGYWLVNRVGRVYAFGDAKPLGSPSGLKEPVVGITRTRSGNGYWVVTRGGNVFGFGDAQVYGTVIDRRLSNIAGLARTPSGRGYWIVTRPGAVFPFGDAQAHGSPAHKHLKKPIVAIVASTTGKGYWLAQQNGHVFAYGDAHDYGSRPKKVHAPIATLVRTTSGHGYWLVGVHGQIFPFGDAQPLTTSRRPNAKTVISAAATPRV